MDVHTAQGTFRGSAHGGVWSFKGIPYAAAPLGPLRFAAPLAPPPHVGIADATEYGATVSAPPQRSAVIDRLLPDPVRVGDNPLNLNVWTPDPGGRQPVLVWIHGGGFLTGTGSTTVFDGGAFARDGIVVVTINYRLGIEGFLHLDDAPPNRGLLDQVAALRWVRENIDRFGGDPNTVTIAGESAGAMSVCTLLAMPSARGLFRRAISQSGDGHHVHPPDLAQRLTDELCRELGVERAAAALSEVDSSFLHSATNEIVGRIAAATDARLRGFRRLTFQPIVDGAVLPRHPVAAVRDGASKDVDLLIGTNAEEYGLFTAPTGLGERMNHDLLMASVERLVDHSEAVVETYRAASPSATPQELFVAIQSDWFCVVPTSIFVDARRAGGADSYVYRFQWRPDTYGGNVGACHTLEVPFVFDNLHDDWGSGLRGRNAPQLLADDMHRAWVRFVQTGDPGWQPHGDSRLIRIFDVVGGVERDETHERQRVWRDSM